MDDRALHDAVFDGMSYTWVTSPEAAPYELAGRTLPWLRNACRERGIASSRLSAKAARDALAAWQVERENTLRGEAG